MGTLGDAKDTDRNDWSDLRMGYETVMPDKWTFQSDKIREWVQSRLKGRVLNACAGKTKLDYGGTIVRNDIDEDRDADLHVDVCEIADHFEPESFGTIVYDPPFSQNQATRTYDGQEVGDDALAKRQFDELLKPGGRVIQFGFSTTCMPMGVTDDHDRSYQRVEVMVWNTLGRMNDYLSVIDEKPGEAELETGWFE